MESGFCHFVFRCGAHSSGRVWCILLCVVERLLFVWPLGVGRQALHPSSPAASSSCTEASSEEEGLHARPLPHILGEYICDIAGYFGGGRIGTFSLPPHIVEEFSGGGGIGPPPHNSGVYFGGGGTGPLPHNVGTFDDFMLAVQCRLFVGMIKLDC